MNIIYLTYHEIDKKKWDDCIQHAVNGLIYAESVYLDHLAANWHALILGDYEAVMPLTWKRKWGIQYLYQPAFIQQGGIFSRKKLSEKTTRSFIEMASLKFRFAEITINYLNIITAEKGIQVKKRNNYVLALGAGYKKISAQYNNYIKQRLSRLAKFSMQYNHSDDLVAAIKLYKKLYGERMGSVANKDFLQFEKLCKTLNNQHRIIIRHVYNNDGKELLAVILLLKDKNRLYNIISAILPKGKKLLANYFLYNEVIKEFSDENILLDFEGSDIPGVAYFYSKFADKNQQYTFVKFNNLPLPIKLLKK